ncbi:MAG: MFS transporter [Leptolyngbyaceae cyanobacterium]
MGEPTSSLQPFRAIRAWLPNLRQEIWILAAGQLLLFIGQGFTLVYASIYFVNQLGFSATQVGIALGAAGLSGILGRFVAGNAVDSLWLGRRRTLLLAAVISGLACFCLAFADTFEVLLVGNLLLGMGISLYWPATLAVTADLTTTENRAEAFALTQLSNNLGLGLGALLAGQYIAHSGSYPGLFSCKGVTYLVVGLVIYVAIAETRPEQGESAPSLLQGWGQALGDRPFAIFLVANIFFAVYGAQLSSSLPLYLANFVPGGNTVTGFSETWISYLFFWHALLKITLQLPITRWVKPIPYGSLLLVALGLWAGAFGLIWATGVISANALVPAVAAFLLVAIAEVIYAPSAIALVGEMAPADLRGVYFALESECWAIGFFIGPALGGWALDHPQDWATALWLGLIASATVAGAILVVLQQRLGEPARVARE